MRRLVAGAILALLVGVVAVAVGTTSIDTVATILALAGAPWSFVAVGVAVSGGPPVLAYVIALASAILNVVLITMLARRVRR